MKKIYLQPVTEYVDMVEENDMLAGSVQGPIEDAGVVESVGFADDEDYDGGDILSRFFGD